MLAQGCPHSIGPEPVSGRIAGEAENIIDAVVFKPMAQDSLS
jgi:hypothetical protein